MNIFYIILNKIKGLFYKNKKVYRLDSPQINCLDDRKIDINKSLNNYFEDSIDVGVNFNLENEAKDKKQFFEMYNLYKNNKIDPQNMLITDLLKLTLMLENERCILDNKVENMKTNISFQDKKIRNLIEEETNLTRKIDENIN